MKTKITIQDLADFWGVTYSSFHRTYITPKDKKKLKQLNIIKLAYICYQHNLDDTEKLEKVFDGVELLREFFES